jgi:winged helix-turn-helix
MIAAAWEIHRNPNPRRIPVRLLHSGRSCSRTHEHCDEKHRSTTPKHAPTAGISRHGREGISIFSGDTPDLVDPDRLGEAPRRCLQVFEVLEGDLTYVNLAPKCEPQLGPRGLYTSVGDQSHAVPSQITLLWVLSLCDGTRSLLEVAERSKMPFAELRRAAVALEAAGLPAAGRARP